MQSADSLSCPEAPYPFKASSLMYVLPALAFRSSAFCPYTHLVWTSVWAGSIWWTKKDREDNTEVEAVYRRLGCDAM